MTASRASAPSALRKRGWRPRLVWGGGSALAGAAVAAAVLVFGLNFERNGGRPDSQYRLAFQPIGPAPANATARAGLRTSQAGTVVRLWVENLPGGTKDVYEVWCDAPGWSASAGTFKVDAQGDALRDPHDRGQEGPVRPDPARPPRAPARTAASRRTTSWGAKLVGEPRGAQSAYPLA